MWAELPMTSRRTLISWPLGTGEDVVLSASVLAIFLAECKEVIAMSLLPSALMATLADLSIKEIRIHLIGRPLRRDLRALHSL